MPKSVVAVAATDTRNAPVIANVGGQRAASHSSRGNANASGSNEIQDCVVWEKTKVEIKAKRVSTTAPSTVSRREGSLRKARENSIMSGVTRLRRQPKWVRDAAIGIRAARLARAG